MKIRIILWIAALLFLLVVVFGVLFYHFLSPPEPEGYALLQAREQVEIDKLQLDSQQAQFLSSWFVITLGTATVIILMGATVVILQVTILQPRHRRRLELAQQIEEITRLYPDQIGNYPKKLTAFGLLEPTSGSFPQPVPHTINYSPHIQLKETPALLEAKHIEQQSRSLPHRLELNELLKVAKSDVRNFELALGQSSAGPIVRPFGSDSLHFGLLGATGSGKTTQEHSILFQLTLADPHAQRIQFGFLDLEGKTSQPFKQAPHTVWVADDSHLASIALVELERQMNERARLSGAELEQVPIYAIVLEEFLSLRNELSGKDWQRVVNLAIRVARRKSF